ncbi:MAG TPA: transposase [Candidatus Acidoferrales bacterium]|nr:transposase [Candidatus Acidoferrales bacterium]
MRRKGKERGEEKFSEAEMIGALKQMETGRTAANVGREPGVSKHTLCAWKAKYGGMSVDAVETLAQWRSQRRGIPYLKIGRAVRYDVADVQLYLEGCSVSVSDPKERRQN